MATYKGFALEPTRQEDGPGYDIFENGQHIGTTLGKLRQACYHVDDILAARNEILKQVDYTDKQRFKRGDRVELSPATDLWIRGARFGTVESVDGTEVWVLVDTTAGLWKTTAEFLRFAR
jgi:hypothetical protein